MDVYETSDTVLFVMEQCHGGELFDYITARRRLSESEAALVLRPMLEAIAYLHEHNVAHRVCESTAQRRSIVLVGGWIIARGSARLHCCVSTAMVPNASSGTYGMHLTVAVRPCPSQDLKPENCLLKSVDDVSSVQLIDFGLARKLASQHTIMKSRVGTPYYIAPEVLHKDYTLACDMWSVGVIAYILLCGYPPFWGNRDQDIFKKIQRGAYSFDGMEWLSVSAVSKHFISQLLAPPHKRLTAEQALQHPWIVYEGHPPTPASQASLVRGLRRFGSFCRLKRVLLQWIARECVPPRNFQLAKTMFRAFDVNGDQQVSPTDLSKAAAMSGMRISVNEAGRIISACLPQVPNQLSVTEFVAATMRKPQYATEDVVLRLFGVLQSGVDGVVPWHQLASYFPSAEDAEIATEEVDFDVRTGLTLRNCMRVLAGDESAW